MKPKSVPNVFTLTFKQNDVIDQLDLSDEYENEEDSDTPLGFVKGKLEKWIEYGEYVKIEFNLEEGTATVLES